MDLSDTALVQHMQGPGFHPQHYHVPSKKRKCLNIKLGFLNFSPFLASQVLVGWFFFFSQMVSVYKVKLPGFFGGYVLIHTTPSKFLNL
jgi:hypothetical protein